MASYYKIFYEISGASGEEVSWVEKDNPENVDFFAALSSDIQKLRPRIIRAIDTDDKGSPTVYDTFKIIDSNGIGYGYLEKLLGTGPEWAYIWPDERTRKAVNEDAFEMQGNKLYTKQWVTELPAKAKINWDRLEVIVGNQILFLKCHGGKAFF